ncbi:hypothetical protein M899_2752 [Bacteriovorax sp. BSW11_IV]|nr:hypothetical protein M899_2752 [Bacteriovorax sp. BSW11_IV]
MNSNRDKMDKNLKKDFLLETLSFYEAMSFENIILDFDSEKLKSIGDFSRDELEEILSELVKEKKLKLTKINGEPRWQKVFKKKKRFWFF